MMSTPNEVLAQWYKKKGWSQFPFQKEVLEAYLEGKSGILNAPTGSGKTYAAWLPVLVDWMQRHPDYRTRKSAGLQVIWITPLRALAKDIANALQSACDDFGIPWRVEMRTGDTSAVKKQKQISDTPECLVTTPESIHVLFAQKNYSRLFKQIQLVVVDEWHELLGSKRGIQTELVLSRFRSLNPHVRTWGISATIGNLSQAMEVLFGMNPAQPTTLVKANIKKLIQVETILPRRVDRYSWAGHLGTILLGRTVPIIEQNRTTLIFTNVRSQTELWFQKFTDMFPDLIGKMAIHHGSLDREVRDRVEEDLHNEKLKAVICTSSLDLGVDFRPVDAVVQVGSPKGVARFVQRAGRSGHRPGDTSKIYFLPTNSLEILESAALQEAIREGVVEPRTPITGSYDVLIQYMITLAVSEGFIGTELYDEVKRTYAYHRLTEREWEWCLDFVTKGGSVLSGYSQYRKVVEKNGRYVVEERQIASRHRMSIGTITSDEIMSIRMRNGRSLGSVEESFVTRLNPGDVFWYAGRALKFLRIREMTAWVDKANTTKAITPRWWGGRMALTSYVAELMQKKLNEAHTGRYEGPEMQALKPLLELQQELSRLPGSEELLIEELESKEGHHLFFYSFAGRLAHEGLSALFAYRIAKRTPTTFSMAMNDYGFELLSDTKIPIAEFLREGLLSTKHLEDDILASVNGAELAKRKFRDIARISGLIFQGYPGKQKRGKHLQSSSELLFDIFVKYDRDNLLVNQAYQEALRMELDEERISQALQAMAKKRIMITPIARPTPFAFPILVDRLRQNLTSEQVEHRIATMQLKLEDRS